MAQIDSSYINLLANILAKGFRYEDTNRKGTYRIQLQSNTFEWDFRNGFPALSTKKLYWKGVVGELLWFLRGDQNIKYLVDNDIHIWDKDAYNHYLKQAKKHDVEPLTMIEFLGEIKKGNLENTNVSTSTYRLGDLGKVYGVQWRSWDTRESVVIGHNGHHNIFGTRVIDQLQELIDNMRAKPMGTRHIVTAWNPADVPDVALPPCHYGYIILPRPMTYEERYKYWFEHNYETGMEYNPKIVPKFDDPYYEPTPEYAFKLKWSQRSVDTFLGLPFNIASYAVLSRIIGKLTGMHPEGIIGDLSNVHIYEPHLDAVKEQMSRDAGKYEMCGMRFNNGSYKPDTNWLEMDLNAFLDELFIEDFELLNYKSYPAIRAEMFALKS